MRFTESVLETYTYGAEGGSEIDSLLPPGARPAGLAYAPSIKQKLASLNRA